ncbi:hypothetical protein L596_011745 [Steinernema carpocapsae]|uniref:Uncharacterized protein n=1 Tax=Steinernema carpocapsae TaxID=34508 RepID=A0A4U5NVB5_STECR|nr:hypothetical protein L596_011745 [Steinernema carpocapsae]
MHRNSENLYDLAFAAAKSPQTTANSTASKQLSHAFYTQPQLFHPQTARNPQNCLKHARKTLELHRRIAFVTRAHAKILNSPIIVAPHTPIPRSGTSCRDHRNHAYRQTNPFVLPFKSTSRITSPRHLHNAICFSPSATLLSPTPPIHTVRASAASFVSKMNS